MTGPQYEPLTQEQVGQLLRDIGAGDEAMASFRDHPEKMTALINSARTSPLDMGTKLALIAALPDAGAAGSGEARN
jgi:hypothetical protein